MIIREARVGEHDALRRLMLEAYDEYHLIFDDVVFGEYAEEIADVEGRLQTSVLIVAEEDGRLLGAVTYFPAGSGGGYDDSWPRAWAGVRLLAVPPHARGRGIGRVLTQACIERARSEGADVLALGTTDYMKTARAMYERMGFTPSPEYDFYPVPDVLVYAYVMPLTEA